MMGSKMSATGKAMAAYIEYHSRLSEMSLEWKLEEVNEHLKKIEGDIDTEETEVNFVVISEKVHAIQNRLKSINTRFIRRWNSE